VIFAFSAIRLFVAQDAAVAELRRNADGEFSQKRLRMCGSGSSSCLPDYANIKPRERA